MEQLHKLSDRNIFAQVKPFQGKLMIHIRRFYVENGNLFPSKTGITLLPNELEAFKQLLPNIERTIDEFQGNSESGKRRGEELTRQYKKPALDRQDADLYQRQSDLSNRAGRVPLMNRPPLHRPSLDVVDHGNSQGFSPSENNPELYY